MNLESLTSEKAKRILAERKAIIAKEKVTKSVKEESAILIFKIDKIEKYALPYQQIERVIPYQTYTPVPGANALFLGIIYHNTEAWPLLSFHQLLKLQGEEELGFYILCKQEGKRLALSVNEVLGQTRLKDSEDLIHFAKEKGAKKPYVRGIYQSDIALIELDAVFDIVKENFK